MLFNCINLNGNRDVEVQKYLDEMEVNLKKGMIGKEKRERFSAEMKSSFDEINTNSVNDMKATMQSIEKSVNETAKDKW